MAREIHSRLIITGTLTTLTPLHVGGYGFHPDTDLPLAQNGQGDVYVPGTSIAGILRSWCEKNFEQSFINKLFGPHRIPGIEEGHASFVLIEDAKILDAENTLAEIRDGVGINRYSGTAADNFKFDRAVLPRGTTLNFKMAVEIADAESAPSTKAIIGHLLTAMQSEQLRFGGAKTRGLGRIKLDQLIIQEQSLCGFAILNAVAGEGKKLSLPQLLESPTIIPAEIPLEIKIHWEPVLPVMVKAGYDGIGVDMLPLTSGVNKTEVAMVLPGSSIKGALRSQAERIVRTVKNLPTKTDFNEQIVVDCVKELFGTRSKSKQEQEAEKNPYNPRLGLGALSIDDCFGENPMSAANWRAVEQATADKDASASKWEITENLKELSDQNFHLAHHVAIDRWTGGASDGALFSVLEPHGVEWEPITLTLDLARYADETEKLKGVMLLLLTLRDVAENRVPFGFGGNRGMGEIKVTSIEGLEKLPRLLDATGEFGVSITKDKLTFAGITEAGSLKHKLQGAWND
jgi:CRISPR/Cas system CSM-associated protein Csm3 (group 7 of RAMP superfamily)